MIPGPRMSDWKKQTRTTPQLCEKTFLCLLANKCLYIWQMLALATSNIPPVGSHGRGDRWPLLTSDLCVCECKPLTITQGPNWFTLSTVAAPPASSSSWKSKRKPSASMAQWTLQLSTGGLSSPLSVAQPLVTINKHQMRTSFRCRVYHFSVDP